MASVWRPADADLAEASEALLPSVGSHRKSWTIAGYEFTRTRGTRRPWGCGKLMRGVAGARTPVGAFIALRRWEREPEYVPAEEHY